MEKSLTSLQNPLVRHITKLRKSKPYRVAQHSAIIQGKKNYYDLYNFLKIKTLFIEEKEPLPPIPEGTLVYRVTESVLKKMSGLPAPEGILAELSLPSLPKLSFEGKTLLMECPQDPGNVGTLCRTAKAFSWDRLILITPTVDPFNDKVTRSAKGANFLLPIYILSKEEFFQAFAQEKPTLILADLKGPIYTQAPVSSTNSILALGSEATGPSAQLKAHAQPYSIPMTPPIDSLNVAAAGNILMAHLSFGATK